MTSSVVQPPTQSLGETRKHIYSNPCIYQILTPIRRPRIFYSTFFIHKFYNPSGRGAKAHARVRLLLGFAQGHTCPHEACGFVLKLSILVSAC